MDEKAPVWFLRGKLIALRAVEPGDAEFIWRWLNDREVTHFMFYGQTPKNRDQAEALIMDQVRSATNTVFMVVDVHSGAALGFAGLYDIHPTARRAEFRVLIGEKTVWGKGVGTEVTELLTFYGFDRLNLHRIWLGVVTENKGAVRAYEKAGYLPEGVLRDDLYRNSRYYDDGRYAILRDDYYARLYQKHLALFGTAGRG